MSPYYVVLTGSKNNAGDFLIRHRAMALFEAWRPDRDIVEFNAWEPFDEERLRIVNGAKALILLGGPSLQPSMYPGIYPLVSDLDAITAPIVTMGIGWKSLRGEWRDTFDYPMSEPSVRLLEKIATSGYMSSVRDYHTLNVLNERGLESFRMTGCPAYYVPTEIGKECPAPKSLQKIAFSLGVSFLHSEKMLAQMQRIVLALQEMFSDRQFEVVFHHSLDRARFLKTHNATRRHVDGHNRFASWLAERGISYIDISGSAERLMEYYGDVDLHVGYRVHAHIFMNSVSRPSLLIAEDGRGKATREVIGGLVLDAFDGVNNTVVDKLVRKIGMRDLFDVPSMLETNVRRLIKYETDTDFVRALSTRCRIDRNYSVMTHFLQQLP